MERFQNTAQPDWDWWGKLWPTPGETLRQFDLGPGDTVAEIGSGNGYFTLPLARIVDPGQVYALDIDSSLLDELEALADQQRISNVLTVCCDARLLTEHLPDVVDVVLIANTFHGVDDPVSFLEDVATILAENGRVVLINWRDLPQETTTVAGDTRGPPTDLRLSPTETTRIIADAVDLTLTQEVDIPPYHYALVFEQ